MSVSKNSRVQERRCVVMLAVVSVALAGAGTAAAQTVIVRSARPGATIEVLNNGATVSATADASGDATLAATLPATASEQDVRISVDTCPDDLVRVLIFQAGRLPPDPAPGCNRKEQWGVYIMRPVTTFVVDVAGRDATLHLRQGPAPIEWLSRLPASERPSTWGSPRTGLAVSAGVGLTKLGNAARVTCGDLSSCTADGARFSTAFGADYWVTRFLAAHVGYLRPANLTAIGSGTGFNFDSVLATRLVTVAAKVGKAVGPVRFYGVAGTNHHQSTFTTTQTIDDTTTVVGGTTVTIKGGTQVFAQHTAGWNWLLGGGVEAWLQHGVAIYGEFQRARLKARPTAGGEGGIDDHATALVVGARVHIGR